MPNEPLPEPYNEIRQIKRDYARQHQEIWADHRRSKQEKEWDGGGLWGARMIGWQMCTAQIPHLEKW
jgi:hypothetical protein